MSGSHERLTHAGRRLRLAALALAAVALVAGTAWGEDDHFPFGPFRMYANATKTTGRVITPRLEATTATGDDIHVLWTDLGLRRAELEGQMNRLTKDRDELLEAIAETYHRRNPDAPELVEVRLERRITHLDDGEVTGREQETVAVYRP